jgi:hypothetical protein
VYGNDYRDRRGGLGLMGISPGHTVFFSDQLRLVGHYPH